MTNITLVFSSGELAHEYEEKRISMLKTQEDTTTTYHKKKVRILE